MNSDNSTDSDNENITLFVKNNYCDDASLEITEFLNRETAHKSGIHNVSCDFVGASCFRTKHIRPTMYVEHWIPQYTQEDFYGLFRMYPKNFKTLLRETEGIAPEIRKDFIGGNPVICPEKKLLVTLTYLGTQMSMLRIGEIFNLATSTVYNVLQECINYIIRLKDKYIKWPTKEESVKIANKFEALANFPNLIGAIDGTHINVKVPSNQQDSYTNRKAGKSIIMQAICTSEKLLTHVCVGFPGSAHDARVLANSEINRTIELLGSDSLFYGKYHLLKDS